VCACVYMCVCARACACVHMCVVCMYVRVCACGVCACVHARTCVYVWVCDQTNDQDKHSTLLQLMQADAGF